ncbi:MAG: Calx-beta domain-containing protein, partial [Dolichospermum sp.]
MANNFNWIDATTLNGMLWDNGILSSVASINQIGSLSILGASHKYLYTSLINSGTISQNISGYTLFLNQSANINNSGIYEFQAGEIRNAPNSVGVFNNSGTFRKTSSGLSIVSVPFYNTGTVNVELGTLLLLGGGSSNGGIFNISSGGTLEIKSSSSLTNNTYFLDSNAQINGTGTLMISGGFLELARDWAFPTTTINILWSAGIKSSGTVTNPGSLTIQNSAYLYASLNNTGTITHLILRRSSPGTVSSLSLNQSANINNSGIYEFQSGELDNEIRNAPNSVGVFNNSGTFRKTNAGTAIVSVPFYNTGTVNVELGTLLLLGGGRSNGGIFNISRFGTLELKSAGATLTNNTYLLDSNTQINGTGTLMISGGFLELDSDWTLPTTTINILRNAGIKSPGTITNAAGLTIQGNAYLYASLNNTGTIVQNLVLSNPSDRLSLNQSANINNSGIYEFQAGEIRNQVDSIGVFNNSGTFRKTSSGLSIVSVPFYNTGTIESVMGTVSFYNSYTHNNANLILKSGNVSFTNPLTINGGNIEGNGNINATITNSGLLNPRYVSNTEFGRLTINGNYTETNNASINIQLGGNTAAVNFDQIDINGTANFDGTLNVSLLNGFTPTLGSTFDVLTYDALNSLSNLDFTGLDINSTLQFLPQWSSNKLTLKVVDKSAPILAIAPTNVVESESHSGTKPFTFTVTRSVNTTGTNNVNWAVTVTGSGTFPANATDFVGGLLPSGVVSFAPGETSKVITVNVQGDTTVEPNENFTVTLSNATNGATITTATATGTINNDDFIGTSGPDTLAGTSGA